MPTATAMETRARAKADQNDSTFPTSAQYLEFLNDGAEAAWGRMIAAGWDPRSTASITATGASAYTVGTTAEVVLSVACVDGSRYWPLRRAAPEDLPDLRSFGAGRAEWYNLYYDPTAGLKIELLPSPASGSYEVRYIPRFTRFTAGSDTWNGPARTDDYICVYAAIQAVWKEGNDASHLQQELASIEEDMVRRLAWLDAQYSGRVRDVYSGRQVNPYDDFGVDPDGL